MIITTNRLRKINKELVIKVLKESEFGTKNHIAKVTGLSISTCRNILNDLIVSGEVKEVDFISSNGGRPSKKYVYNKNYAYTGIIYLRIEGGESILFSSILNMGGQHISEQTEIFLQIDLEIIEKSINRMIENYPKLKVICLGIPGVVLDGVVGICDIKALEHIPIKKKIEEKYPIKIILENDVNASALGYYQNKNITGFESIVYIYYPYLGIPGAGIIINGKVLKGHTNFAGEVGFLPIGVDYREQGELQNNFTKFSKFIVNTILSVNSIINPGKISISWQDLNEENFKVIKNMVLNLSVPGHAPALTYNSDIHSDYVDGLAFLALKEMSCKIEVIEL